MMDKKEKVQSLVIWALQFCRIGVIFCP